MITDRRASDPAGTAAKQLSRRLGNSLRPRRMSIGSSGLLASLALTACSHQAPTPPPDCSFQGGPVRTDLTLHKACSPYAIKGGVDVLENATLTIEPGVEVRFGPRDWL